jgi:hypothetical protein
MFISLRESCANGFKRWSDLQQKKYGDERAANVNSRIGFPKPDFDAADMTALVAESSGKLGGSDAG